MNTQELLKSMAIMVIILMALSFAVSWITLKFGSKYLQDKMGLTKPAGRNDMEKVLSAVIVFWMLAAIYSVISFGMYLVLSKVVGIKEPLKSAGLKLSA